MIYNDRLDRLLEVDVVKTFVKRHRMTAKLCTTDESTSFLLFRFPMVVEIRDALVEDYLELRLVDLRSGLMLDGDAALGCSLDLGLQSLTEILNRDFESHPQNDIFLSWQSWQSMKMDDLNSNLEAIDLLLPRIEAQGGLESMRSGSFDRRYEFKDSVHPILRSEADRYLRCIEDESVDTPAPLGTSAAQAVTTSRTAAPMEISYPARRLEPTFAPHAAREGMKSLQHPGFFLGG